MNKHYPALNILKLSEKNHYAHPPKMPELLHLNDPALDALINFASSQPAICQKQSKISEVFVEMKASGMHIMLVVENNTVVGVISSEDILGEKPMQVIQERRIKRDEVPVAAIMTPRDHLVSVDYHELSHSKVGQLLTTLDATKQRHLLVITQNEDGEQIVQGLIYIYDMIKRLDKNLSLEMKEAGSLLELQKRLS